MSTNTAKKDVESSKVDLNIMSLVKKSIVAVVLFSMLLSSLSGKLLGINGPNPKCPLPLKTRNVNHLGNLIANHTSIADWYTELSTNPNVDLFEDVPSECYFSPNYEEAVQQFLNLANQVGAEVWEMPVTTVDGRSLEEAASAIAKGEDVNLLTTQVAVLRGHPNRFFIHMSGTHGTESYSGSAIQAAALHMLSATEAFSPSRPNAGTTEDSVPTIIFVHANNPFGFKHSRRTNENNVDLNRNFLTDEQWKFVLNRDPNYSGYEEVDSFLNPTSRPLGHPVLNEFYSVLVAGWAVFKYGIGTLKKGMVSGNYHKQPGYGFGGFERSQSVENLIDLLTKKLDLPNLSEKLVMLDVHTGLGDAGVDTLLYMTGDGLTNKEMDDIFPTEINAKGKVVGGVKSGSFGQKTSSVGECNDQTCPKEDAGQTMANAVSQGYELTLGTTESFCGNFVAPHLGGTDRVCVTQEFGTLPTIFVGICSVNENYAWHYGSPREKLHHKKRMRDCYALPTKKWKQNVMSRGLITFYQAMNHAIKPPSA